MGKYLVDRYRDIAGCETPDNLFLSWEAGFDFPEDMYEPIRILAETYLHIRQDEIRDYFFWGVWEDEEETKPAEDAVYIFIAPYAGYMQIRFKKKYKKSDEFIDLDEVSYFPTPFELEPDQDTKYGLAQFRVGYDGIKSTIEERQKNPLIIVLPPCIRMGRGMNAVLQKRQAESIMGVFDDFEKEITAICEDVEKNL